MTVFGLKQVGYVARLARGCANFSVCGRREATGHVAGLEDQGHGWDGHVRDIEDDSEAGI